VQNLVLRSQVAAARAAERLDELRLIDVRAGEPNEGIQISLDPLIPYPTGNSTVEEFAAQVGEVWYE
jgi:hypothetical protein